MKNNEFIIRLKRLRIIGFMGVFYSSYLFYELYEKQLSIGILILAITLLIASILFLISSYYLKNKKKK